jgi:transcriptional regulator with XRE-family HTH domain
MLNFGQFIKSKRESLKLSQQSLTDACGFAHRAEISRLEADKLEWKLSQVIAIAALFGMSASELLSEFEAMNNGSH